MDLISTQVRKEQWLMFGHYYFNTTLFIRSRTPKDS